LPDSLPTAPGSFQEVVFSSGSSIQISVGELSLFLFPLGRSTCPGSALLEIGINGALFPTFSDFLPDHPLVVPTACDEVPKLLGATSVPTAGSIFPQMLDDSGAALQGASLSRKREVPIRKTLFTWCSTVFSEGYHGAHIPEVLMSSPAISVLGHFFADFTLTVTPHPS